jgi:hypothetical protein
MRRPVTASHHMSIIKYCVAVLFFIRATFDELVGRSGIELVVHLLGSQLHYYLLMIRSYQLSAQNGIRGSCAAIRLSDNW